MTLLDRFRTQTAGEVVGYDALEIDAELATALKGHAPTNRLAVRPDKDNGGIEAMSGVLESLHTVETESSLLRARNVSPAHTFEMRYAPTHAGGERVVTLQYVPGSEAAAGTFHRQLGVHYPESRIESAEPTFLTARPGQYLAGATLGLRRYTLLPIKNIDLPGFRADPTGSILQEMVAAQERSATDADVIVQLMFKPARRTWTQGVSNGHGPADADDPNIIGTPSLTDLSYNLRQPTLERHRKVFTYERLEKPPTTVDKNVAKLLEDQQGSKGWRLCCRILVVSDDPDVAITRASKVAGQFRNFYESASEQTFIPTPQTGQALRDCAHRAARREFTDRGLVKAQREVAGLVNIPEADHVVTTKLKWELASPGDGIPPGTPRADWDALGIDPLGATTEQKQIALLDDDDGVTWYGLGTRHGIEAGINYEHVTNPHKFVHGQSGVGKTTFLAGDASQQFRRPGGGLRLDPTGDDTDDILAEWPDDRDPADLIYMDLSGDHDRIPRFNFLEVPTYLEPDTRQFNEFIEKLAEDILAMVGAAGGDDEYVGALMKRVLKTVVRGLGQAGMNATLDDVAAVCSSSEGLERFAEQLEFPDGRVDVVKRIHSRIRALAERNNTDLDPLAGRLDEWVLNPNVRELICAREPTFSITDAIADGREIVVKMSDSGSDTVKHMVGTALITRTYFAQRFHRPDVPFELVVDEAQSILTSASDIENIMDQGRKFDYRVTIACQRPATQLNDRVRAAVLGNARTTISYDSGRREEADAVVGQHRGIDVEDLTHLSPYQFYMNTETADRESTHSYKVDAFRAPREARIMAAEQAGTDPETTAAVIEARVDELKAASLDRYGATRDSVEQGHSPLIGPGPDRTEDVAASDRAADAGVDDHEIVKAVYDTALRTDREWVSIKDVLPTLVDRFGFDGDVNDAWRELLQDVDGLDAREHEQTTQLKAMTPRQYIATIGTDQSAGGAAHNLLMWDAYHPLTKAGLDCTISEASGTDPDMVARPAPDPAAPELVRHLTDGRDARVEAEHQTGKTKPGATVRHVVQAAEEGRRAIVLCRPEIASRIREILFGDPPCARARNGDEIHYYNSPRGLRIAGEPVERPGSSESVWVRNTTTGEISLRDSDGTEHARFDDLEAVFTDADAYPSVSTGQTIVKQPVIPPFDGPPDATIVIVPEGARELSDLSIGVQPDVSERARPLYDLLRTQVGVGGTFTRQDALDLTSEHGLEVADVTVWRWLSDLTDAGVIHGGETTESRATLFTLLVA